ncbi:MAG: ATP-binding protein [Desulfobacterium sp.]
MNSVIKQFTTMFTRPGYPIIILFTLMGMAILCSLSFVQKVTAGFNPYVLKGYYVPLIFGGGSGLTIGIYISKQKAVEAVLKANAIRFRTIADFTHDWEYWIKPDGCFEYISPSCQLITGYEPEALFSHPELFIEMVHPEDLPIFKRHLQKEKSSDAPGAISFRIITRGGEHRWISHSCRSVYDENGQYLGKRGSNRDITETKKLQQKQFEQQRMESIATLAGGVAHQFNNALAVITGNMELMQEDLFPNDIFKNYAHEIKGATDRMTRLTAQLLAYARGGKYRVQNISLNRFIKETLPIIRHAIHSNVKIHINLQSNDIKISGDPIQIQMVLSAVVTNACEAMDGNGEIYIKCQKIIAKKENPATPPELSPGAYVCMTITDNGKGMDEETQERIFEPFFSTRFEGRGLGMAAAFGIIDNHKGSIKVTSQKDKGSTISIFIPLVIPEPALPSESIESAPSTMA